MKNDDMQFGLAHSKRITDAIVIVGEAQEKFKANDNGHYYAFIDLEKEFGRVTSL